MLVRSRVTSRTAESYPNELTLRQWCSSILVYHYFYISIYNTHSLWSRIHVDDSIPETLGDGDVTLEIEGLSISVGIANEICMEYPLPRSHLSATREPSNRTSPGAARMGM